MRSYVEWWSDGLTEDCLVGLLRERDARHDTTDAVVGWAAERTLLAARLTGCNQTYSLRSWTHTACSQADRLQPDVLVT